MRQTNSVLWMDGAQFVKVRHMVQSVVAIWYRIEVRCVILGARSSNCCNNRSVVCVLQRSASGQQRSLGSMNTSVSCKSPQSVAK